MGNLDEGVGGPGPRKTEAPERVQAPEVVDSLPQAEEKVLREVGTMREQVAATLADLETRMARAGGVVEFGATVRLNELKKRFADTWQEGSGHEKSRFAMGAEGGMFSRLASVVSRIAGALGLSEFSELRAMNAELQALKRGLGTAGMTEAEQKAHFDKFWTHAHVDSSREGEAVPVRAFQKRMKAFEQEVYQYHLGWPKNRNVPKDVEERLSSIRSKFGVSTQGSDRLQTPVRLGKYTMDLEEAERLLTEAQRLWAERSEKR